jgi:glycosyltransferase involved in cell wall biosynthesis
MMPRKLLVIASHLLGNQTYANELKGILSGRPELAPTYLELGGAEYARANTGFGRLGDVFRSERMVREALADIRPAGYDGLIVLCWEFLTALPREWLERPIAVVQDITPASSRDVGRFMDSRIRAAVRPFLRGLHHWRFSLRVPRVACFLPMSDWVAASLMQQYGVQQERVRAAYLPMDLDVWRPAVSAPSPKLRLLFVGNDLVQKGGHFLLNLHQQFLHEYCTLTIVSRDPLANDLVVPEGVVVHPGVARQDMVSLYQESDLLVLPTYRDALGHVIAEAAACGVPTIARNVGGVHCIVRDGITGRLMAVGATTEEWATAIAGLNSDRQMLHRMSIDARSMAEAVFDRNAFEEALDWALMQMWRKT